MLLNLVICVVVCAVVIVICQAALYYKSEQGTMDITWDDDNQVWTGKIRISDSVDFGSKKKLILKIINK